MTEGRGIHSKERDAVEMNQFRPISLLNIEGKIFFSVVLLKIIILQFD